MKCKYCKKDATKGVIWADGRARIPVCEKHVDKAADKVENGNNDAVDEIQTIASVVTKDMIDALDHMSDEAGNELNPDNFKFKKSTMTLDEIGKYTDFSSWPEWDEGELLELDEKERKEELEGFRGRNFYQRAQKWLSSGFPPIVIVELADGRVDVGDGRGRITVALGMGVKKLPVIYMTERSVTSGKHTKTLIADSPRDIKCNTKMNRVIAELVTKAALVVAKEDPNSYKKRVGRCPRGYRFDGDKCVPSGGGSEKKKGVGKDTYKLDKKIRGAKTLGDVPNGFAGIKDSFGAQLGITKYPPKDINPKTIKIDLSGDSDSHAVMTWKDKKGRTQASYSNTFKKRNAAKKWERVKKLEKKYGKAVAGFEKQLANGKTPRARDAAAAMLLIAKTGLRPGGESHLKASGHRGIGTLSPKNVTIDGDTIKLKFVGKAGKENNATLTDQNLAKYLKGRLADPASKDRLFETRDADLSGAMKKSGLGQFKPKDFRTRRAGQLASEVLSRIDDPPPLPEGKGKAKKLIKQRIAEAAKVVSDALNNTPSVAKSSYINPAIIQGWLKLIGGEQYATATAGDEKFSADEIFKTSLDVTLPGHDQDATPIDEDDPQLEEDPIPLA